MFDPRTLSRRSLILGGSVLAGSGLLGKPAVAQAAASVAATNPSKIHLYLEATAESTEVGTIPAGSSVQVLAGPDVNGWYLVEAGNGSDAGPGWTPGDGLSFNGRAQILWDAGVYSGPTDTSGWVGSIWHYFVVTVAGPDTNGFTFVRSGELSGFTYSSALQPTELPLTDPNAERWIDANRSTLEVKLMIGEAAVDTFPSSMSSETGDGFRSTAVGTWWIYEKVEGLQFTTYADAYFMYWCGFDPGRFNGFHSWTMDSAGYLINGGWGNTAGCIATEPRHAKIIYNFLSLNSRVEIHW